MIAIRFSIFGDRVIVVKVLGDLFLHLSIEKVKC
jgi:hypothetical protein